MAGRQRGARYGSFGTVQGEVGLDPAHSIAPPHRPSPCSEVAVAVPTVLPVPVSSEEIDVAIAALVDHGQDSVHSCEEESKGGNNLHIHSSSSLDMSERRRSLIMFIV